MNPTIRDRFIYKVLTFSQWTEFQRSRSFTGSPVDLQDGFIHLSCADQLKVTLDKWYADQVQVVLLQVEAAVVEESVKYEISRGGAEFPHLFAPLPLGAVCQTWLVSPKSGVYSLPEDLTAN